VILKMINLDDWADERIFFQNNFFHLPRIILLKNKLEVEGGDSGAEDSGAASCGATGQLWV
jgi:hypothetical protein